MRTIRIVSIGTVAIAIAIASFLGPFAFMTILGLAGGGIVAALLHWKSLPGGPDPFANRTTTDVVNMANIRVAGVGGLGLVAMAIAMVFQFEEAAWLTFYGVAGGAIVAAALVMLRRRTGVLPSSGDRGNSMLIAEDTVEQAPAQPDRHVQRAAVVSA